MRFAKLIARGLLTRLFKIRLRGMEHYAAAGERVLIIANHTSFLDGVLLTVFFPERLTFAVNTLIARKWWVRVFLIWVDFVTLDTDRPQSLRILLRQVRAGRRVVMFPEGRITLTGTLMKTYAGSGWLADRADAAILPVGIDGPQFTPWSRMHGRLRLRWFPPVRLTVMPARRLRCDANLRGRARREAATRYVADTMAETMFNAAEYHCTLFEKLMAAGEVYGGRTDAVEDFGREPLSYGDLIHGALRAGAVMRGLERDRARVGLLVANDNAGLLAFLGTQVCAQLPVMLDYRRGAQALLAACRATGVRRIYATRELIERHAERALADRLSTYCPLTYIDDVIAGRGHRSIGGWWARRYPRATYRRLSGCPDAGSAAVIFMVDGGNGRPRGAALSHVNLLANCHQLVARIDANVQDKLLNVLPFSTLYGLNTATLLPLFFGMRVFFFTTTRPRRTAPERAYELAATMLVGDDALLAGFGASAHPYDFHNTRYVFAAGRLADATRHRWQQRFGLRILEAYGKTETGPVLAVNTPIENRVGTAGRMLPGIQSRIAAAGGGRRGRLSVKGPNVMLGYVSADATEPPRLPSSSWGEGWFDTGDVVEIDADGFVTPEYGEQDDD